MKERTSEVCLERNCSFSLQCKILVCNKRSKSKLDALCSRIQDSSTLRVQDTNLTSPEENFGLS